MTSLRYWCVILMMTLATVVLYRRGDVDSVPPSTPLDQLPHTIGEWTGSDVAIEAETLETLGKGQFLNRLYYPTASATNATEPRTAVNLFIGYFPTQRSGQSIHSPQHCLPGAGWVFESAGVTDLPGADGKTEQVGDFLISNGNIRDEVLYWYQSHGRVTSNDYKAKFYMLADSIRYNRTDAALIRIVVPVSPGLTREQAHETALAFARKAIPLLPAYIPN